MHNRGHFHATITLSPPPLPALDTAGWAETYNANGTGHGKSMSTPMPLSEDLIVVQAHTMYDGFDSENPDNPLASVTGPCFGDIMIDKGAVSGDGLCHYTDAGGDTVVMKWTASGMTAEGRTTGDWMVMGGTGKWMGASGGGTFDAGTDAMDKYTNMVTGEVTLP